MAKITLLRKLHVHAFAGTPVNEQALLVYTSSPCLNSQYVLLGTVDIELKIDTAEVTAAQITQIKAFMKQEAADSQLRLSAFQASINTLTCIEG